MHQGRGEVVDGLGVRPGEVDEAAALRALADDLPAGDGRERDVAVLGDLNDEARAATTQILLGPPGSEIGTPAFEAPDQGDAARLWDVAPLIPADRRCSRINSGRRELIDHILTGHHLIHRLTTAGTGTGAGPQEERLPSVGANPSTRRNEPASDHAPVWVRIG